ncbi:aminodeoxychorismate synthase component I [Marinobacteraceae bacterium S3BR75-40.1]
MILPQRRRLDVMPISNAGPLVEKLAGESGFVQLGPPPSLRDAEGKAGGRYSITSALPEFELQLRAGSSEDQFNAIQQALDSHLKQAALTNDSMTEDCPFTGGFIGYAAYELGFFCEPALLDYVADLPPDTLLLHAAFYSWGLIQDHIEGRSFLVFHPSCPEAKKQRLLKELLSEDIPQAEQTSFSMTAPFRALESKKEYLQKIRHIQDGIRAGDCYQVNLSQCFEGAFTGSSWQAYKALTTVIAAPFSAYLALPDHCVLSLSPERFIRIQDDRLETKPIKGTRPRGHTPATDSRLKEELIQSPKDRAENLMIVDLLRNDLGRSCQTGSIRVERLFEVESYKNVHHLVSTITGRLKPDVRAFSALLNAYPGGSITGAPKIQAMKVIKKRENVTRGPYCGSVFYLSTDGQADSSIAIRTALCQQGKIRFWGGGGIVMDSDPETEYEETLTKVKLMMDLLEKM